jgi:hypothetical protein
MISSSPCGRFSWQLTHSAISVKQSHPDSLTPRLPKLTGSTGCLNSNRLLRLVCGFGIAAVPL